MRRRSDAGDYLIYAPIVRCYAHGFDDPGCSYNRAYASALSGWNQIRPHLPVMVLEYYNVSKFEDLPLLFTHSMAHDFQVYRRTGAAGFVYMHVPLVNWGMRALTQVLFAELAWDPDADIAKIKAEFLSRRYGAYAGQLRSVYDQIDMASQQITSWRAWKDRSLLSRLQSWNGGRPERPLQVDDHFQTPEAFDTAGEQTLSLLQAALLTLRETRYRGHPYRYRHSGKSCAAAQRTAKRAAASCAGGRPPASGLRNRYHAAHAPHGTVLYRALCRMR